jgi:hypothetical protein
MDAAAVAALSMTVAEEGLPPPAETSSLLGAGGAGDWLPRGWETAVSTSTGETYYINSYTQDSTYERPWEDATPQPLPEGWDYDWSTGTGEVYYVNTLTQESSYERPYEPATAPRLPRLLVRQITGEQTVLHLSLDDTIGALKEALRAEWGIEADAQRLLLLAATAVGDAEAGGGEGGLPLEADETVTLRACGLADGTELLLTPQDAAQGAGRRMECLNKCSNTPCQILCGLVSLLAFVAYVALLSYATEGCGGTDCGPHGSCSHHGHHGTCTCERGWSSSGRMG